jgi:hypothetical protein
MNDPQKQNPADNGVGSTGGSASGEITDDPEYQAWVESMAKHCRCRNGDVPCDGVLAGGPCDEMPDPREDEDPRDQEDREGGKYY